MAAAMRAQEVKAANSVRRVIQKVRLATPETVQALEAEVFDSMAQELENIGSLREKVQEEIEKGLDLARKRVEQIQARREKEEEAAARPKALMEEMQELMEALQGKLANLRTVAGLEEGSPEMAPTDAEAVAKLADETGADIKDFSQACVARATEIKDVQLSPEVKKTWTDLAHQIVDVKRKAEASVASAKAATQKAAEGARKKQLEVMKALLRERVKESSASVPIAEEYVSEAEKQVEPFIKEKLREEAEMLAMAEKVDEAVAAAKSSLADARQELNPADGDDGEDTDELLKKEIQAFIAAEAKRPHLRLGQLERRLDRVTNIVARYRKEIRTGKNKAMLAELKAELLEKVKASAGSMGPVDAAEPAVRAAEKSVESCGRHRGMSLAEMLEVAEEAARAVDAAKAALSSASQEICPIDESLDEDLKKQLRALAAPELRRPQLKLGQMDRRATRAANLLAQFRAELSKKRAAEHNEVRSAMLKVVRHHFRVNGLAADVLFDRLATPTNEGGTAAVEKGAFLAFIESTGRLVKKVGTEDEEETVDLPSEGLSALFASHVPKAGSGLDRNAFMQLVGAHMQVVKPITLTVALSIADSKIVRQLKAGETLETLEGPVKDGKAGVLRVRVRALKDGKEGWATIAGNAGSLFLKEGGA